MKHLSENGCEVYAEGKKHTKVRNSESGRRSTIPRHTEIDNDLARGICIQLGIPRIG